MEEKQEQHCLSGNLVEVEVMSFDELFDMEAWPLAIDSYQRGFVWRSDKIAQLADDLLAYQTIASPKPAYYMGTILLHRCARTKKRYIIDGQQRLTALCVLHQSITNELPPQCEMRYSSASARVIRAAAAQLRRAKLPLRPAWSAYLTFTVVQVSRADQAFTFFDTQNNRGIPLHATDLMKAYHLRAVTGTTTAEQESLQRHCARQWELMQNDKQALAHKQVQVQTIFTRLLWRARRWTGNGTPEGHHQALLDEFQSRSLRSEGAPNEVALYRARGNRLASSLIFSETGASTLQGSDVVGSAHSIDLPFAIRQPLHRGLGFFLYANKYAALLRWLLLDETKDVERVRFREVHEKLLRKSSLYLEEVFVLGALCYVDQFGHERLWEFSLWFEHALGAVRIEKQQVRQESAQKFFRDGASMNLLDVIASAFLPEQVIDHLKSRPCKSYLDEDIRIEKKAGVQATYKKAVLAYYGQPADGGLAEIREWIPIRLATK